MTEVLRQRLCDLLEKEGCFRTPAVRQAFMQVPRHLFLPDVPIDQVYEDRSFYTKLRNGQPISSSSQPAIMACMLEQLGLEPGQRVLEIGAGTGYNAALIGHIVGPKGSVVSIDIDDDLVQAAQDHLAAAGVTNVAVVRADGAEGYPQQSPYDRILLTVGAWDIAPAWLSQLRRDGRLVLPLSFRRVQKSVAFEWDDGYLESVSVESCGFMRMRGSMTGRERIIQLGPAPGPYLTVESERQIDADGLFQALSSPPTIQPTRVAIRSREDVGSLSLWLALRDPDACSLAIFGPPSLVEQSSVPLLLEYQSGDKVERATFAVASDQGLVCLSRPPGIDLADSNAQWALSLVGFAAEPELITRMHEHLGAWVVAGRPAADRLRIRAYPAPTSPAISAGDHVITKHFTTLVLTQK